MTIEPWELDNPTATSASSVQAVSGQDPFAEQRLVSYTLPAPQATAANFLRQARGQARIYWQDGRSDVTFAGFGLAANLFAWGERRFAQIEQQARALFHEALLLNEGPKLAAPRLFGGFAFNDDFMPDNTWSVHHPAHFILPHYQLVRIGRESWLTINALLPLDESPALLRDDLHQALLARYELLCQTEGEAAPATDSGQVASSAPPPAAPTITYPMSYEAWAAGINEARHRIATTPLEKVVLARICELRFEQPVDVEGALAYLKQHYGGCYRFLFEPRPHHAFYGATPELLAQVNGRTFHSMGLAGSIRRSSDPLQDELLGQQLLNSAKDRHEHEVVVMALLNRLAPITSKLEIAPQPGVYKLSNIQHLHTPVRAELQTAQGILSLVELLHPTPAMGGAPRDLALDFISQAEPAPRGWYAAPIGWIDHNLDGTFAVAIRSAVSQYERAWLYAGAGIVADSDPDLEWQETALKFRPMMECLGIYK
ncbi:MAG: isochorismate synthase [Chloroflexota bacterium]